jgi:hypothetical protein
MVILNMYSDVYLLVNILKVHQLCFVYACDCMEVSNIGITNLFFINFLERVAVAGAFLFISEILGTQYFMFSVLEAASFRIQLLTHCCLWFPTSVLLLNFSS